MKTKETFCYLGFETQKLVNKYSYSNIYIYEKIVLSLVLSLSNGVAL